MKRFKFALACMVAVAAVGCSSDEPDLNKKEDPQIVPDAPYVKIQMSKGETEVANAGYSFAWNLFDKVNTEKAGENVCLSPTSANIALTMLLNGAENETLKEIINVLGLDGMSVDEINKNSQFLVSKLIDRDKNCKLHVANSLWIDEKMPIKDAYKATLADYFAATTQNTNTTNFAKDVNAWCSKQTKGLISDLVKSGESYDWALLNAIYFQNIWSKSVKFESAGQKEFKNFNGARVMTTFMRGEIPCHYGKTTSARHAHIDFGNGAYRMSVTLPNEGASIEQCIAELKDHEAFSDVIYTDIDLTMPKFEFKVEYELNGALASMGINKAFRVKDAQFPYISDIPTFVKMVKQACSIKVDEKGATAAAVTIIGGCTSAEPTPLRPEPMVVDRPFIFTIYEQSTGCILFIGKIEKF